MLLVLHISYSADTYQTNDVNVNWHLYYISHTLLIHTVPLPEPANDVNVTSISANSISLSWSVPSDSAETSSEVVWQVGSSNSSSSETVMTSGNLSDTNYTIEQLESATIYIITIIVFNAAGSIDSPPIIVSTSQSIYTQ